MAIDAAVGEGFLGELTRAAAKDAAGFLVPGSSTAAFLLERGAAACAKAAWDCLQKRKSQQQRQQMINSMTQIHPDRSRTITTAEVDCYAFSPETKAELVNYFYAIPMTARHAITRPNDGGKPTTLLSQLPRTHTDLVRFMPVRPPHFQPGNQVPGHDYQLEILLGQGGFAEVWKARHVIQHAQPAVALKFCLDPALLASLKTEIRVYEQLKEHPDNVVRLVSTAYTANPPFLVYEYVDGGDLAAWMADFDGKVPSVRDVVRILKMTARALAYAHERGIVHRDLKPANLLITRDGNVKVADFGIGAVTAAVAERGRGKSITAATFLQGAYTPMYADRRQRDGEAPDPGFDVYALGVIGYQLLIGDTTREMDLAWRAEHEQKNADAKLLDVIAACVDIPGKRLPNAGALLAALDKLERHQSSTTTRNDTVAEAKVNYCIHCGEKILADDRFCTRCGHQV